MQSWQKFCPDYLIVEWNEKNFNIKECPQYVIDAYHRKKWAFVTDYVRLRVVYEYGGIYFDTDVELVKKIDFLLKYSAFFGFELKLSISPLSLIIRCSLNPKNHPIEHFPRSASPLNVL